MPDAATEAAVRAEWDALAAAGLSSAGRHTGASNRPHVTLLVRTSLAAFDAAPLVARPVPLVLGAPVLFGAGDRRVLARSVVPSPELFALHADLHAAAGAGDDLPHTAPGEWTPHVTLGRRMRVADLERALGLLGDEVHGSAATLRRWDAASATVTELGIFAR
ncbi:2'-5' RNA ligase family protein [Microbacterium sp. NPDC091313]